MGLTVPLRGLEQAPRRRPADGHGAQPLKGGGVRLAVDDFGVATRRWATCTRLPVPTSARQKRFRPRLHGHAFARPGAERGGYSPRHGPRSSPRRGGHGTRPSRCATSATSRRATCSSRPMHLGGAAVAETGVIDVSRHMQRSPCHQPRVDGRRTLSGSSRVWQRQHAVGKDNGCASRPHPAAERGTTRPHEGASARDPCHHEARDRSRLARLATECPPAGRRLALDLLATACGAGPVHNAWVP